MRECKTCKTLSTTKWYGHGTECKKCYRKRNYKKKECKYSTDKVLSMLKENYGDQITLQIDSYKGFGYSAIFIDKDYGVFTAKPHNVIIRGHGHKSRTLQKRKQTNVKKFGKPFASQSDEIKKKMTFIPNNAYCNVSDYIKIRNNIKKNIRSRLRDFTFRGDKWIALGCSLEDLKIHLESQFQEGMSWDNYGLHGWHIDHIKPLSKFDLTDEEQFKEACHYTNLQPLWAKDNLSKGAKDAS